MLAYEGPCRRTLVPPNVASWGINSSETFWGKTPTPLYYIHLVNSFFYCCTQVEYWPEIASFSIEISKFFRGTTGPIPGETYIAYLSHRLWAWASYTHKHFSSHPLPNIELHIKPSSAYGHIHWRIQGESAWVLGHPKQKNKTAKKSKIKNWEVYSFVRQNRHEIVSWSTAISKFSGRTSWVFLYDTTLLNGNTIFPILYFGVRTLAIKTFGTTRNLTLKHMFGGNWKLSLFMVGNWEMPFFEAGE